MWRRESNDAQASLKSLHFSGESRSFKTEKGKKKKRWDSRLKECDRRFGIIVLGNLVSIQIETVKGWLRCRKAPGSLVV